MTTPGETTETTTVTVPEITEQELEARELSLGAQRISFEALEDFAAFVQQSRGELNISLDQFLADNKIQREAVAGIIAQQDELFNKLGGIIDAGGEATDEERRLINEAVDLALAEGRSDIDESAQEALRLIREELAPGLGFRPGDAPIIDRGNLVGREQVRQTGQLSRGLERSRVENTLNFPLARGKFQADVLTRGLGFTETARNFDAQLNRDAFNNRLGTNQQIANLGLNLSALGDPNSFINILQTGRNQQATEFSQTQFEATTTFLEDIQSGLNARAVTISNA